jgi:hypothetical protein
VPLNVATKDDIKAAVEELKKWAEEKFVTKKDLKQFATKEDLKQFATKQDLEKWFVTKEYFDAVIKREDKMATKEQIESITISVEDSGREMVQYLLEQRGYKCAAERLRLDADYELDIYCNAGVLTAVGEAKVRAGGRDVEKALRGLRSCYEEATRQDLRQACASALHTGGRALSHPKGKGAQDMAH